MYLSRPRHAGPIALAVLCLSLLGVSLPAQALPSFARQLGGMPCASCHAAAFGPALTEFGRQFKLNGYVMGAGNGLPPLSGMIVESYVQTRKGQVGGAAPGFRDNRNFVMDQASVFYGGRIAGKVGAMVQVTYSQIDHKVAWDNLDIRYADTATVHDHGITWGVTLNNNPTVTDPWNSTPAWSFPYMGSDLAPGPAAAVLIEGGLGQLSMGVTGYAMIDNHVYVEGGGYRTLSRRTLKKLGVGDEIDSQGLSPYWRTAAQFQQGPHYESVGLFGLQSRLIPEPGAGSDRYTDVGFDATYQYSGGSGHAVGANATLVRESQRLEATQALGGSDNAGVHLSTVRVNATYIYQQTWSAGIGPFAIAGSHDATLYGDNASGSPDSRGYTAQLEYVPFGKTPKDATWMNLRLGLQYTGYTRFDGSRDDYDGAGRSASDNNTLYLFSWLAF